MSNRLSIYNDSKSISGNELIDQYGSLVNRIAHNMLARLPTSVQVDDLIQSGMIGLLEASRKYDKSRGASFETYAGIRIRGAMIDEIRKGDWVPRSVHRNSRKVSEAVKRVEASLGRDATDKEIAGQLGMSLKEYYTVIQDTMCGYLFSFDSLIGEEEPEDQSVGGSSSPLEGIQKSTLRNKLAEAISQLPEREQLVIALYYDEELNLKEIGQVIGVGESRVSQIHSQAAVRLRAKMQEWTDGG